MTLEDPQYLLNHQYKDAKNLNARIRLHALFSTNPQGIHAWMFDQFDLPEHGTLLELGCGPGTLWQENPHRVPAGWRIRLTDFSPGMVAAARQNLTGRDQFTFELVNAQSIPYDEASFDAVMAHYMLYHVPDRQKALAEIARVLKPGGHFFAMTVGENHLLELFEMLHEFDPDEESRLSPTPFLLENGADQISTFFTSTELRRYEDSLAITETGPLVDYILSSFRLGQNMTGEAKIAALRANLDARLAREGIIRVQKHSGMFMAVK